MKKLWITFLKSIAQDFFFCYDDLCAPVCGGFTSFFIHKLWIILWISSIKLCISARVIPTTARPSGKPFSVAYANLGGVFVDKQGAAALWEKASQLIKSEINSVSYDYWFQDLQPADWDGEKLTLMADNDFGRNLLKEKYDELIRTALQRAAGRPVSYVILTPAEAAAPVKSAPPAAPDKDSGSMLNPKYTFSTYVIGKSNNFAHAAAYAVSQSPGDTYNPLFLYSGVGLGKTHLMHAIGHAILEKNPSARILYITSETFTNDLVKAIGSNTNFEFRNRYRNVDVLMVDDIQFIAGKESTQEEFFHTFNTLHTAGKQIILTSDRPPQEIARLEDRLKSRFAWGLTCDIKKPDVETRIAILREKARQENITMDEDVYEAIATRVESNIRELEGSLTRLVAYAQLTNRPITVQLCEEALHDIFAKKVRKEVTAQVIMQTVANYYSITVDDLIRPTRRREIAVPRQIAMYITRDLTNLSLPQIGQVFGNRDHTTVLHGCNQIANAIKNDSSMASVVNDLKEIIVDNK